MINDIIERGNEKCNIKFHETFVPNFKALTLDELEVGFVVSLAPLVISLVAFCFEWTVRPNDQLVFLSILKAHFKMKHNERFRFFKNLNNKLHLFSAWKSIFWFI